MDEDAKPAAGVGGSLKKTSPGRRRLVLRASVATVALAVIAGLVLTLGAAGGSASTLKLVQGHGSLGPLARTASESAPAGAAECVVNSLPSFMDQGEFGNSSSIADVVEVECEPVYAEHTIRFSSEELYSRCQHHLSWSLPYPYKAVTGPSFSVTLDNDGNATAVIWGGPSCAAGESLISAHMEQAPYLTVTTPFVVQPPRPRRPACTRSPAKRSRTRKPAAWPPSSTSSSRPCSPRHDVNINAEQLYSRCHVPPKLLWVGAGGGTPRRRLEPRRPASSTTTATRSSCSSAAGRARAAPARSKRASNRPPTRPTRPPSRSCRPSRRCRCRRNSRSKSSSAWEAKRPSRRANSRAGRPDGRIRDRRPQHRQHAAAVQPASRTPDCEGISGGPGEKPVQPGQATVFTCTHRLTAPGDLDQRRHDRRQRRHRQEGIQRSRRQSPADSADTGLHDRKAPADRATGSLHQERTHRRHRPDRQLRDHRPQHRRR